MTGQDSGVLLAGLLQKDARKSVAKLPIFIGKQAVRRLAQRRRAKAIFDVAGESAVEVLRDDLAFLQ